MLQSFLITMPKFRINLRAKRYRGNFGTSIVSNGLLYGHVPEVLTLNLDTAEKVAPSIADSLKTLKMYIKLGEDDDQQSSKFRRFLMALISLCISRIYW